MRRSLTLQVLLALAAGLALGTAASLSSRPGLVRLAGALEPAGTLWVNAILMTVLPLVVSGLVVAVVSAARTRLVGSLGRRAAALFLVLLAAVAAVSALVVPPVIAALPIGADALASFRESLSAQPPAAAPRLTVGDWIAGLLPSNVFRASADGALLPLVLFTLLFAAAVSRVSDGPRETLLAFFRGISEAMTVLLGWIVRLAPVAIFVLSLALAARVGPAATGALGLYVLVLSGLCVVLTLAVELLPRVFARVPLGTFARAAAPAQLVAFAAHSSLASLPAMLEGAERVLGVPRPVSRFVLPLAVSTLKISAPVHCLVAVFFVARLAGVSIAPGEIAALAVLSLAVSFSVPGSSPRRDPRDGSDPRGGRPADAGGRPAAGRGRHPERVPQRGQHDRQHDRRGDPGAPGPRDPGFRSGLYLGGMTGAAPAASAAALNAATSSSRIFCSRASTASSSVSRSR